MADKYQFDNKPWIDGSVAVLKNGALTICPERSALPVQGALEGSVSLVFPPCTVACPRLHQVIRQKKDEPSVSQSGYIFSCERSPQFVEIADASLIKTSLKIEPKN
jgi:hypothetical protein